MLSDSCENIDDSVDPRVQVELERLNAATDEINRLEVDLDVSRHQFRQLLVESSHRIEACTKKLGSCIEKARPYYDARIKAKEALRETQQVAAKYEKANSGHAAAKEMVFLAEEGLRTEGRTFDHAWQEMLNHATMRVNESEAERTACENEHKTISQNFQLAEARVHTLQRELKRAITKSRPYFELKIQYNQLLEEQKHKVKSLETQVAETKLRYAETLRNLEQISDEIHKTRQYFKAKHDQKTDDESNDLHSPSNKIESSSETSCNDDVKRENGEFNTKSIHKAISGSSVADVEEWSETTDAPVSEGFAERDSVLSENESSFTTFLDSESEDDVLKAQSSKASRLPSINTQVGTDPLTDIYCGASTFEGIGFCSFPVNHITAPGESYNRSEDLEDVKTWTEIQLKSPEDSSFRTIKKTHICDEEEYDIPYIPLSEPEREGSSHSLKSPMDSTQDQSFLNWITARNEKKDVATDSNATVKKINRRQSLDTIWGSATSEKMKEMLTHSILKLSIAGINERRNSDAKVHEIKEETTIESANSALQEGSQFGLRFLGKKAKTNAEPSTETTQCQSDAQDGSGYQISGFMTRKDKFFARKVPNPLERTLSFLNADEESASDSESLSSVDMITDEQLSALVLDQDLTEIYQDIL